MCVHILILLLLGINNIVSYWERSLIFFGYTLFIIVSRKYNKKWSIRNTLYPESITPHISDLLRWKSHLNSPHTMERIQDARSNLGKLFYTTISSNKFLATEFTAFKKLSSYSICATLHIYSHVLKSYFMCYYFLFNHIQALSVISSYISKIDVNVMYIHFIHRAISWYKRASESFFFIAVADKKYIDHVLFRSFVYRVSIPLLSLHCSKKPSLRTEF